MKLTAANQLPESTLYSVTTVSTEIYDLVLSSGGHIVRVAVQADRIYPSESGPPALVLVPDSWDDYHYTTTYDLWIRTANMFRNLGKVKVGRVGLGERERPFSGGSEFTTGLPKEYFSLGQDDSYYETIRDFGEPLRADVFESLQDIAYSESAFEVSSAQQVTDVSLLRSIKRGTVIRQFRRIAQGGVRLSTFSFKYQYPAGTDFLTSPELTFNVDPESNPPTNVHVIIGRNSVGKTTLLQRLARTLREPNNHNFGEIEDMADREAEPFVNLVSVAFSAFDPFDYPEFFDSSSSEGISFSYVGLRANVDPARVFMTDVDEAVGRILKNANELAEEFADSLQEIISVGRHGRWRSAVELLENDPNFADYAVTSLLDRATELRNEEEIATDREKARVLFDGMSSGHKIVLLTMTRLVEVVVERSLVLLDEPESHLHPPLLAAFIRALSELLIDRNGVAVIATHSPVVLQEVPSGCVWKLRRRGDVLIAERPEMETFGESIGALTHDVFGLEVTGSGFHREIAQAVDRFETYEQIIRHFNGQLGGEGKAMVRILLADRNRGTA
ncbi:AAA family ATPase [Rhodococcus sp. NPDC059968]|uniref:AAA family ATPase n=1 Tax=Rhodococcus sp. NPDC059968 TaxID=3347017 RepID=UPI00366B92EC